MTPRETVVLTEYIRQCCPHQAMGEYTSDAWHDLLGDLSLADCREAVTVVAKRQAFVHPSEIRAEVRRIREERLDREPVPPPPPELLDDPGAYSRFLRDSARQIADGPPERTAIEGGR